MLADLYEKPLTEWLSTELEVQIQNYTGMEEDMCEVMVGRVASILEWET